MPRNIAGVYLLPANTEAIDGEIASATAYNEVLADIKNDLNGVRPVGSGGTGVSTLADFANALGGVANLGTRLGLTAASSNLSDLTNVATAQTNLGITALGKTRIVGTVNSAFTTGAATTQGAGPISATDQVVVITSTPVADGSVTVPAFVTGDTGKTITIWNRGTLNAVVYPAAGMAFNDLAVNAPYYLPPFYIMEVQYVSATASLVSLKALIDYPQDLRTVAEGYASLNETEVPSLAWIEGYRNLTSLGHGQTWQAMTASRAASTAYQNTTGRPIQVNIQPSNVGINRNIQVSLNGTSGWLSVMSSAGTEIYWQTAIVPPGHWYRYTGGFNAWNELR